MFCFLVLVKFLSWKLMSFLRYEKIYVLKTSVFNVKFFKEGLSVLRTDLIILSNSILIFPETLLFSRWARWYQSLALESTERAAAHFRSPFSPLHTIKRYRIPITHDRKKQFSSKQNQPKQQQCAGYGISSCKKSPFMSSMAKYPCWFFLRCQLTAWNFAMKFYDFS